MFQQGENTSDSKETTGYDGKRDGFGDGVSTSLNLRK
jgi:hypothetical protein